MIGLPPQTRVKGQQQEGGNVFDDFRSEMLQVEDAEFIRAPYYSYSS